MILGIDASNLSAGGGVTYLRQLLAHVDMASGFDQILVFGKPQLDDEMASLWGEPVRLISQVELATNVWRSLSASAIPAYVANVLRTQRWRNKALPRLLEEYKVDVLLSPGGLIPYKWPHTTRVVTMSRNMLPFQSKETARYGISFQRLRLSLIKRNQLIGFHRADGVIFLSRHAQGTITSLLPEVATKSTIIPNGVDSSFRRSQTVREEKKDTKTLLYVSTIDSYKHQWNVVEAVARLIAIGYKNVRLQLVGWLYKPSARRLQKTISRLNMEHAVRLSGPVASSELPKIYHNASIFIFASSCENCPITLLEAMASGLPIACSDRSPMPEFAKDGACYFDPENPASIASTVEKMLKDDRLRLEKAQRAYELSTTYTWERCARETFTFLKDIGHKTSQENIVLAGQSNIAL